MQEIDPRELARRFERLFRYLRQHAPDEVVQFAVESVGEPTRSIVAASDDPAAWLAAWQEKLAEWRQVIAHLRKLPVTRFCRECGKPFVARTLRKIYCSRRCANRATVREWKRRHRIASMK